MWNPDQYLKYKDERTQPSYDLVSRIALPNPEKIIDIGCGPGNSTRVLRERWPMAQIVGLDNSPEMIESARAACPDGTWILADAASWDPDEKFEVVFSNAALQWIPDHETLVGKLFAWLAPGGVLAVQVPAISESHVHRALLKVSRSQAWSHRMVGCEGKLTYHPPGFYYDVLSAITDRFSIWQTTYYHILASHQGLIDWYASTGMRPYLERLENEAQKEAFCEQMLEECRPHFLPQSDGKILFPFNRLFFLAIHDK